HVACWTRLTRALRAWSCDVVHFQWTPLPVVDAWFLSSLRGILPLVLTLHDSTPFNDAPSSPIQRIGTTSILTAFDRLIVHTERAKRRLGQQGIDPDRVHQIPHGLLHQTPAPIASEAALPADDRVEFLQFGHIKPYKGVDLLIRAVAGLPPA